MTVSASALTRTVSITPLVADFTANPASVVTHSPVSFNGSASGEVTTWSWDFGDGGTSTAQNAIYTYTTGDIYTVSLTVTGPGGSATKTKTNYITVTVPVPPPVADFSVSATSGTAPFTVDFSDTSLGEVTAYSWNFGDDSRGSGATVAHIYAEAGTYDVTLIASGPGGADYETKLDLITVSTGGGGNPQYPRLEVGEAQVDDQSEWHWIAFENTFEEPLIVVAKLLSANDTTPATVRIRDIDSTGFEIRVQEWDYLDDIHDLETVSYLAMESGSWELDDGTRIEANRIETAATTFWESVVFEQPFGTSPLVLAAVTTYSEADAVTTRLRKVDADQFQVRMYEQEANPKSHTVETISYIAWEPSSGMLDGVSFEVGATPDKVTHKPYAISYQSTFAAPSVFLADMQTTGGGDTSNVRWRNRTDSGVEVWIQEEQSRDSEMKHTTEVVGYLSFGQ